MMSASTVADVQETRLAVSFYGGVALAVYESGVAVELFRLVKGEGVYREIQALIGRVSVDVITGTSAGGLNGAVLANALVNRGDVTKLLTLWRDEGSIDKLLYGPFKTDPRSLLDGDRFRQKIFDALQARRAAPAGEAALQPSLDLFITATNLDGDRVPIETPDGETIATRTHRQVFHFAYHEPVPGGDSERCNDFEGDENLCRLAVAARTTASFPMAFEPVLVTRAQLGTRAEHLEADAYHIDGGVLDNKPIALATAAIAARRADRKVTRLLFYVEPDPEEIVSRACQTEARTYSPFDVALKALVPLPSYQSITSALQELQRHNETVRHRRRMLGYYETTAARYRSSRGTSIADDRGPDGEAGTGADSEEYGRTVFVAAENRPSALYRAQEDGYFDLRLKDLCPKLLEVLDALRERATDGVDAADTQWSATVARSLYVLKRAILDTFDLGYQRRLYRYLVQVVRGLYPDRVADPVSPPAWYLAVTAGLNRLKDSLYDQEALVRRQERSGASEQEAEFERLEAQLRSAVEELRARGRGETPTLAGGQGLLDELLSQIESSDFVQRRRAFIAALRRGVWQRMKNDALALLDELPADAPEGVRQGIEQGYWTLRDALDSFFMRDILLYPIMQSEELSAELETVRFARISPADADQYVPGLTARQKLAGEPLGHFGGFLDEAWRGNDLTWGRLDTAEILLRKLLPPEQWEHRGRDLLVRAQADIVTDMEGRGMGIYSSATHDRAHLIGEQDLSAIPIGRKAKWSGRAGLTLLKMLRRTLKDSRAQWPVRKLVGGLDYAIHALTWLFLGATFLWGLLLRSRALRYSLPVVAIMLVGIMLWQASLCWWAKQLVPRITCPGP